MSVSIEPCSICLEVYTLNSPPFNAHPDLINGVSHLFHEQCIRGWLKQEKNCPNCRELVFEIRMAKIIEQDDVSSVQEEVPQAKGWIAAVAALYKKVIG